MTLPDPNQLVESLIVQARTLVDREWGVVGIYSGGVLIAERMHAALEIGTPLGCLATTFHRDDFDRRGLHRERRPTHIPFAVEGRNILLVDDVLYTGRTVRAAINELFDFGRPRSIVLACLLDRGGRQLPFAAQLLGATLPLTDAEMFVLALDEAGQLQLRCEPQVHRSSEDHPSR
jgi:pyrimidine operon attenuation protein / uracil phosphoribosyltransferase